MYKAYGGVLKNSLTTILCLAVLLSIAAFALELETAKAVDSLALSIPVPYFTTVNTDHVGPLPNVVFELDITSSITGGAAGTLSVNSIDACSVLGSCWFTDSDGNSLGSSVNIASIPGSGKYFYNIEKGGNATGVEELDFTLTPSGCAGSCPAVATATAKLMVATTASRAIGVGYPSAFLADTNSTTTPQPQTVELFNHGNAILQWSASTDQSWCHLSATSGDIDTSYYGFTNVSVDSPSAAGLGAGTYTCHITWSAVNDQLWPVPFSSSITYAISDPNPLAPTISQATCDALTLQWNQVDGATGYNIYRSSNYWGDTLQFASATEIQSNYQGLSYTDTAINLIKQSDIYSSVGLGDYYDYWVEPIGVSGGPIPALIANNHQTLASMSVYGSPSAIFALRCGSGMSVLPQGQSGFFPPQGTDGSLVYSISGYGIIVNYGNAPLDYTVTGSGPDCTIDNGNTTDTGTLAPGDVVGIHTTFHSAYNRPGNYTCRYTFTDSNSDPAGIVDGGLSLSSWTTNSSNTVTADTSVCGQITLHWSPVSDISTYKILRMQHGPSDFLSQHEYGSVAGIVTVATFSAGPYPPANDRYSFTDTTAVPGVQYDYAVQPVGGYYSTNTNWPFFIMPAESQNTNTVGGDTATECQPLSAGPVCSSSNPGPCQGSGATWYEYDFYLPDRTTVGASFRYPELIKDYTPSNLPIPGFTDFYNAPGPSTLNPCDMTTNSSGELDCLSQDVHGGVFEYIFNFGGMPRSTGAFTGSGWDAPDHSVSSEGTVFLQDGEIKTVLKDGPDPLCGQVKITWNYTGVADLFKIYRDGHYIGSSPYPDNYFIYSVFDSSPHTYSVTAVVNGSEISPVIWSGNPVAADACNPPTSVTLNNTATCGQMVIDWTGVTNASSYNVYRNTSGNTPDTANDLLQSGLTSTTYTDTAPPAATSTPYYYFVAAIGSSGESLATGGTTNPSSINACVGNLNDSDIDVVGVNGTQLYTNPSLPNGSQCNSSTDALPQNLVLNLGDILKFSVNLCNDHGNNSLVMSRVTNPLINLSMPHGYADFNANFNSDHLSYDGAHASSYSPAPGHYFVYGSMPNQTIVFNLSGDSISQGGVAALTYEAQLAVPSGFAGALSRFQSGFNPVYDAGSGPARYTPLLPFNVGPNNSPSIKEGK